MPPTDDERLAVAVRAAREGGRVAREHLGDPLYFKLKGRRDLFVGASLEVQDVIRGVVSGAFPEDGFLGEEGPDDEVMPIDAEHLWLVDPIDGSNNYFYGVPLFSVSVAYRGPHGMRVGVVYDPMRNELFSTRFGGGAFLNGNAIYVSRPGEGEDAYDQMLMGTDWPGDAVARTDALRAATHVGNRMQGILSLGSPALALCYVACGRMHGYFHLHLQLWDVAAAALILQEAGGILTNLTGGSWLHSEGGYLATNGAMHGPMLRLLRSALPDRLGGSHHEGRGE